MFCRNCGDSLTSGDLSCARCGLLGKAVDGPASSGSVLRRRPGVITMIAILEIVVGLVATVGAVVTFTVMIRTAIAGGLTRSPFSHGSLFFYFFMIPVVLLGFLGLATLIVGNGVLRLSPWARQAQIVLSGVGLLVSCVEFLASSLNLFLRLSAVGGAIISGVILFYFLMPGMRVLFSGRPVSAMTGDEITALGALRKSGAGVAIALLAVLIGEVVLMRVRDPLSASDRFKGVQAWTKGKVRDARDARAKRKLEARVAFARETPDGMRSAAKQTALDMRSLASAWEARATDVNTYSLPEALGEWELDHATLTGMLAPTYIRMVPASDGWGNGLRFKATAQTYRIISAASDGRFQDNPPEGATPNFHYDIIYSNGKFVSYPEGIGAQ